MAAISESGGLAVRRKGLEADNIASSKAEPAERMSSAPEDKTCAAEALASVENIKFVNYNA